MKVYGLKIMSIKKLNKWKEFVAEFQLTEYMEGQFERYLALLQEWNDIHNLTAIEGNERILMDHFWDSLNIAKFYDFKSIKSICDVGAGPGLPGIPLKIMYPHLNLFLIEVNQKKVAFLEEVQEALSLSETTIYELDWRTFLRKTNYTIDLFVSRAALEVEELLRCLKPGCFYKNATLIYWASKHWEPTAKEKVLLINTIEYKVGNKHRAYAFFKNT